VTTKPHLVAFLPWLRLKNEQTIAGIQFVSLRDGEGVLHRLLTDAGAALESIVSSYVDLKGDPVPTCTVATVPGCGWDLAGDDVETVQWAATLLFLGAWAANAYFPKFFGPYVNSSYFRPVFQRFSDATWIAIGSRRLDGETLDGGYKHGEIRFSRPVQCSPNSAGVVDEAFLKGLDAATKAKSPTMQRLATALPFVSLSNTDDDLMSWKAEAVLMASAFEQLFNADASKQKLKEGLGDVLAAHGSATTEEALHVREHIRLDAEWADEQRKGWVHRIWIAEFYDLRSKAAHKGTPEMRKWGWTPREHLLMAAWVFPLAVKLLLEREGHYSLTLKDRGRCRSIDKLLATADWGAQSELPGNAEHTWDVVVRRSEHDLWFAGVVKKLEDIRRDKAPVSSDETGID